MSVEGMAGVKGRRMLTPSSRAHWSATVLVIVLITCTLMLSVVRAQFATISPIHDENPTWKLLTDEDDETLFTGRMGHATAQFDDKIWIVAGRSDVYQTFEIRRAERNADVYYSEDGGASWTQVTHLAGDFSVQNSKAIQPGPETPFWPRYAHTLDPWDLDGDEEADIMVLLGGFAPNAYNDVWITPNGFNWSYIGDADWSPRGWHSTVKFDRSLWVLGGSPLNNEVWHTTNISRAGDSWIVEWEQIETVGSMWSPRAGMGLTRHFCTPHNDTIASRGCLVVSGGFGGWPYEDDRYDGLRSRADVWESYDGRNWTLIVDPAPWGARAWHSLTSWGHVDNDTLDVSNPNTSARMWLFGGGFIGTDLVETVSTMTGYTDTWWSRDGGSWTKVNYEEGESESLYTTSDWAITSVDDAERHIGKYAHTVEKVTHELGSGETVQSLLLIAGETTDDGPLENDVWRSTGALFCELDGIPCVGMGTCDLVTNTGCTCDRKDVTGDYCDKFVVDIVSSGRSWRTTSLVWVAAATLSALLGTAWLS